MSNQFRIVKKWMEDAGQFEEKTKEELISLYENLSNEEAAEFIAEFNTYWSGALRLGLSEIEAKFGFPSNPGPIVPSRANQVKEALDNIWTSFGFLAALGLDGDKLFMDLAENNHKKIKSKVIREDGKLGTPDDVKAQLKKEINEKIERALDANR